MKTLLRSAALILIAGSVYVNAQPASSSKSVRKLANDLARAYVGKRLGTLDASRPYHNSTKFVIEHSLAGDDDKDRFEIRTFKRLAQAESWLRRRGSEPGFPRRQSSPLKSCRKSTCTYDVQGMLHNNLFLMRFTYGSRNGRPFIKTVYLTDGD